jgi:hypothetical protein
MNMNPVLSSNDSFAAVVQQMTSPTSAAIGKLGATEFELVHFYLIAKKRNAPLHADLLPMLTENAGMFPSSLETAKQIADLLLRSVMEMTAISVWYRPSDEISLYNIFNRTAQRIALQGLECFLSPNPADWWTAHLAAGTRVLVVSPFASTIRAQVPHLKEIWAARPGLWANGLHFECMAFPLSFGVQSPEIQDQMITTYRDSIGLIHAIQEEMDKIDYDVAIVGAGIHSLPLVAHAKRQGKRAIHTGGATQIYFGIRGGRWDSQEPFITFFNNAWVRPVAEERPAHFQRVEGGCYW